jgi:hypothetical protein
LRVVFLFFIFFICSADVFCQDKGELDLGDIFVWGEDKSALPGIGERDRFLYPYLSKSGFLNPLGPDYPEKKTPGEYYPGGSGTSIRAGAGSFNEYFLEASRSAYNPRGWFYGIQARGVRETIQDKDFDFKGAGGTLEVGRNYSLWNWRIGGAGVWNDSSVTGNIRKAEAEITGDLLGIYVNPYGNIKRGLTEDFSAGEYDAGIDVQFPVIHRHLISVGTRLGSLEIQEKEIKRNRIILSYLNTLFRDFSFSFDLGYRDLEHIISAAMITGEFLDTGYRIYYESVFNDRDIFILYREFPFLVFNEVFEPEEKNTLGFGVNKDLNIFEARINGGLSNVENYLAVIGGPEDLSVYNLKRDINIFELSAGIRKGGIGIDYTFRNSDEPLPYFCDELRLSLVTDLFNIKERPLGIISALNFISGFDVWDDTVPNTKQEIEHYINWDMEFRYNLSGSAGISIGAQNLLGQEIVPPGRYRDSKTKYYAVVSWSGI